MVDHGFNLMVASPKCGKTALAVHVFACAARGDSQCLGAPIRKKWNKLIIAGTDMPRSQWAKILCREGLGVQATDPETGEPNFIPGDDVILWDQGSNCRMTELGVKAMRKAALEHPDSLLIIDSLRSSFDSNLDECKAEIRGPIEQFKDATRDCQLTTILIHHANKGITGSSAINAASGSNAIAGACDGTVLLKPLIPEESRSDRRIIAVPDGRIVGEPILIELTAEGEGRWVAHGDLEQVQQEQRIFEVEEKLTNRQEQVYDKAHDLAEGGTHITSNFVVTEFNLTRQKAYRTLEQLARKGLLVRCGTLSTGLDGREQILYAPTLTELAEKTRTLPRNNRSHAGESNKEVLSDLSVLSPDSSEDRTHETAKPSSVSTPARQPRTAIPHHTPVERLVGGQWKGGWLVHDGTNPDAITIVELGNPQKKIRNCRLDLDVRQTDSPFAKPTVDLNNLPF